MKGERDCLVPCRGMKISQAAQLQKKEDDSVFLVLLCWTYLFWGRLSVLHRQVDRVNAHYRPLFFAIVPLD